MQLNEKIEEFYFDMTPDTARKVFRELRDYPQVRSQVSQHTKALGFKILLAEGRHSKAHLEQIYAA